MPIRSGGNMDPAYPKTRWQQETDRKKDRKLVGELITSSKECSEE